MPPLVKRLTQEFGRGFEARNLSDMRTLQAFPIRDALRHELSWTHCRRLLRVESETACRWYITKAIRQNWSFRRLERQISLLHYKRLFANQEKA